MTVVRQQQESVSPVNYRTSDGRLSEFQRFAAPSGTIGPVAVTVLVNLKEHHVLFRFIDVHNQLRFGISKNWCEAEKNDSGYLRFLMLCSPCTRGERGLASPADVQGRMYGISAGFY